MKWALLLALAAGGAQAADELPANAAAEVLPVADQTSFNDAVNRVLANSPNAGIAAAELRRAGDLVEQARAASLPTLVATGQYGLEGPSALANVGITNTAGQQVSGLYYGYAAGTLTVPLLAPVAWSTWAHALNDQTTAKWTEKETRRQLALGTAHAYLTVIAQKRIVETNRRACDADRAHLDYTQKRLAGGLGAPLDAMRARQQYESDAASLQAAVLGLERAQEALGAMLGEDHAVDTLDVPALETPTDQAEGLAAAHDLRPDLQQADAARRGAKQVATDNWLDFLPTVSGSYVPYWEWPLLIPQHPIIWQLSLTATWTIYDGGLRYGQHKERKEKLLESELTLQNQTLQADMEVRTDFKAVGRNELALAAAKAAASAAHQAMEVANEQYKAGATTNIDVVDAERRAHDADASAVIAEDAMRQSKLDLLGALGKFP